MDLRAVKAATSPELAACTAAAARNAQGLLHDAEVLAKAGCTARAYSLAALTVEECGKAACLAVLAVLPKRLRAHAPVGRMLEWHQLKQVGGLLGAVAPDAARKLAAMPAAQATRILSTLSALADEVDRLKRRGFYVDMDRGATISEPSDITEAEVSEQIARARRAVASASRLLTAEIQSRLASPAAESREVAGAMVEALAETGDDRTPDAAADVIVRTVGKLQGGSTRSVP
jgi:AbiV family abortive infection protein